MCIAICFVGYPGMGKSSVIQLVAQEPPKLDPLGVHAARINQAIDSIKVLHVGDFAAAHGLQDPAAFRSGGLIENPQLIRAFLDEAITSLEQGTPVILDGFPRSPEQAQMLVDRWEASKRKWPLQAIHLTVPKRQTWRYSFAWQLERAERRGEQRAYGRYFKKILRAWRLDMPAIKQLQTRGIPVKAIPATIHFEQIYQEVIRFVSNGHPES